MAVLSEVERGCNSASTSHFFTVKLHVPSSHILFRGGSIYHSPPQLAGDHFSSPAGYEAVFSKSEQTRTQSPGSDPMKWYAEPDACDPGSGIFQQALPTHPSMTSSFPCTFSCCYSRTSHLSSSAASPGGWGSDPHQYLCQSIREVPSLATVAVATADVSIVAKGHGKGPHCGPRVKMWKSSTYGKQQRSVFPERL